MSRKAKVAYRVYEFIKTYKEENDGNSPTYERIADNYGWSPQNAWLHVERLVRYGLLKVDENRRITVIDGEYIPPIRRPNLA